MNTNPTAKRILCYGDSNTRGRDPSGAGLKRYSSKERRPGILQDLLGNDFEIIEEWLWARTTAFDDPRPELPGRNWLAMLVPILDTHVPLDIIIFMLGTTDTKPMMQATSEDIGEGMRKLIQTVKEFKLINNALPPKILVIVPPIVKDDAEFAATIFQWGTKKGNELIEIYRKIAQEEWVHYLDSSKDIHADETEGVHIDAHQHQVLAKLIYEKIKNK